MDVDLIRENYSAGRISRSEANAKTIEVLRKALSPGGQRFDRYFPKGINLDFMREDIGKIVNNTLTGNKSNWHGYYRELKYINSIEATDGRFRLVEAGSRNRISDGRIVEFDILVQDRRTEAKLVIESKDWKIKSQAELDKAKAQLEKVAKRAREEGVERFVWVNRKGSISPELSDELRKFGQKHNVNVYDNVSTGEATVRRKKAQHIDNVLEKESKLIAKTSARRVAKVIPYVGVVIESGIVIHKTWQWQSGRVTTRDLVVTGGGAAGGIAGATGGAFLGAKGGAVIGSFVPVAGTAVGGVVGAVVGGVAGGITGHIVGSKTTEYAAAKFYYEKMDDKEREVTVDALIVHYSRMLAN